jgi:putative selenate reductase molybdopterin-binding subunit
MSSRTPPPQTITFKTASTRRHSCRPGDAHRREHRPYGTHGLTVQTVSGLRGLSTYNCPVQALRLHVVYTNIPVPGAYRGYGAPQALFALEAHMEDIAEALGMDVIEFKRLNWVKVGDPIDIAPHLGEGRHRERRTCPSSSAAAWRSASPRACGHRLAAPLRPAVAHVPGPPHIRRGLGHSPSACTAPPSRAWTWAAPASRSTTTAFNLLVGATDLGTGSDTVLARSPPRCSACPWSRHHRLLQPTPT